MPDEPDLQSLLDQLAPDEESDPGDLWSEGSIDPSELIITEDFVDNPAPEIADIESNIAKIDNIGASSDSALSNLMDLPPEDKPVNIQKYLTRLDGVTDEILEACRNDRQEAHEIIQLLRTEITNSIGNQSPPPRMYVDGIVKALEVKANINMTAVKMMDANAKMLASTKAGTQVSIQNANTLVEGSPVNNELEQLLADNQLTADDEF